MRWTIEMRRRRIRSSAPWIGFAMCLCVGTAQAHEFWVEPSTFALERGGLLAVRLCVGDGFEGWSLARNTGRIELFAAAGPAGQQPVVGLDGADPAGVARLATDGGYVIAYRSNRAFTEMPAAKFEAYLRDKGLDKILALRGQRGANRAGTREAYSRHSKALIRVGGGVGDIADRRMGLRLELIADPDRYSAAGKDLRSFQLLYEGKPLAGALVKATRPGTADDDLQLRTDAQGRASFRLSAPGMWRIAAVHMIKAPRDVAADFESLWASLTFEIPPQSSTAGQDAAVARPPACSNKIAPSTLQARR